MPASKPQEALPGAAADAESENITADICVIGAGPGGLAVAAAAAAFGRSVVLIERHKIGGDALNYGCVPSKALAAAANRAHAMRTAGIFGIDRRRDPEIDPRTVNAHVQSVIAALEPNFSAERFAGLGVRVIRAAGALHQQEDGRRRRIPHQGAALRHRHRIGAAGAGDPGPRQRALLHQRDDLRQSGASAQPDHHRRRSQCARAGAGAQPARLARDGARGRQGAGRRGSRACPGGARAARGRRRRRARGRRRSRASRAVSAACASTSASAARSTSSRAATCCSPLGRKPAISDLGLEAAGIRHDERGIKVEPRPQDLEPARVRHRRRGRRPALRAGGRLPCRHRHPPRAVPAAGARRCAP